MHCMNFGVAIQGSTNEDGTDECLWIRRAITPNQFGGYVAPIVGQPGVAPSAYRNEPCMLNVLLLTGNGPA